MNADIRSEKSRKFHFPGAILFLILLAALTGCKNRKPEIHDIVKTPAELSTRVRDNINDLLDYSSENGGKINDSTTLVNFSSVKSVYSRNNNAALWSLKGKMLPVADSVYSFIANAKSYGLFPSDYYYAALTSIRHQLSTDTMAAKDAALWSRNDLFLTDALLLVARDLKRGRLPYDSLSTRKDTLIKNTFYTEVLGKVLARKEVVSVLDSLEPTLSGYRELKDGIKGFLDSAEFKNYTYLHYPYEDSVAFFARLQQRLYEEKILDTLAPGMDTLAFKKAISKYQAKKNLRVSGRISEVMIRMLNDTDWNRFIRIALSLDKYKLMADSMPQTYVWVNLPAFQLKVVDSDSVVMTSKVIIGATATRTPELTSNISNFITYPQWTVPYSIVFRDMLPAIKKNIKYLEKQNLMVVDRYDSVIDPAKVNWSKLSKNKFPYLIKQKEGDDNSLGVLKFNFANKYSVYLHDTNARWLFSKNVRALSHGCVRVKEFKELAHFLVRNDTIRYNIDTLSSWIVRQEKHVVSGFKRVPIFIRYFTCVGEGGEAKFYDDVYGEDKILAEKYFSKYIN